MGAGVRKLTIMLFNLPWIIACDVSKDRRSKRMFGFGDNCHDDDGVGILLN
jgi:hypothetical protein